MVTRARTEAPGLMALLEERGATAILAPAIELVDAPDGPLDQAAKELREGGFAWVVFTSAAGVDALFRRLGGRGPSEVAAGTNAAAVGEGTARALRDRGVEPALVPSTFTTDALGLAMPSGTGRVLLARADIASDELDAALAGKGWTPIRVDAYRTRLATELPADADRALREGRVHAVTFTSASTVHGFVGVAAKVWKAAPTRPRVVCIGPVTAAAARAAGMAVEAEARPHTIGGVVTALERMFAEPITSGRAGPKARA